MKFSYHLALLVVGVSLITAHPVEKAVSAETSNGFAQLETLLQAKKWYEADQETTSLIRNSSSNLACPNLNAIDKLWLKHSNQKYGFTPQKQIWQQVGGFKCKTCEDQITNFSKQVGWNLGEQVKPVPGEFIGQYPTVVTLGWLRYVNSDRSLFAQGILGKGSWQSWKIGEEFNFFAMLKNCDK